MNKEATKRLGKKMIDALGSIEDSILALLDDESEWNTLDITYHPPHVERLWRKYANAHRLSLHVIHPTDEDCLIHPHPWASAVSVLNIGGEYEHVIYDMDGNEMTRSITSGPMIYSICNPNTQHSVRPLNYPVYTVMLSSPVIWPQNEDENKDSYDLKELDDDRTKEILETFRHYYKFSR